MQKNHQNFVSYINLDVITLFFLPKNQNCIPTLVYVDIEQGMHKGKIDTAVNAPIHTVVHAAIHVLLLLPIHTEFLHQPTHARGCMAEFKVVYIGESS